ncbi:GTP-dependent dephospho-CoA kinase family protein [Hyperthermus butylicus]|nr:GTP-dependent dephospho-CoA kinase family protein [Hyperthermus butylicus]
MPAAKLLPNDSAVAAYARHRRVVAVGDRVSETLIRHGVKPWVMVFDCVEARRDKTCPSIPEGYAILRTRNERSTVEPGAVEVIRKALRQGHTVVRVDGEEDLLALPALLYGDVGSVVLYGLPGKGVVAAAVNREAKLLAMRVLEFFEPC